MLGTTRSKTSRPSDTITNKLATIHSTNHQLVNHGIPLLYTPIKNNSTSLTASTSLESYDSYSSEDYHDDHPLQPSLLTRQAASKMKQIKRGRSSHKMNTKLNDVNNEQAANHYSYHPDDDRDAHSYETSNSSTSSYTTSSPPKVTSYTISSSSARLPSTVRKYMKKCNNMGTTTSKNRNDKGEHEQHGTVAAVKDPSPVKKSGSRVKMTKTPLTNDNETKQQRENNNIAMPMEQSARQRRRIKAQEQLDRKKKEEEITTIMKEVTRRQKVKALVQRRKEHNEKKLIMKQQQQEEEKKKQKKQLVNNEDANTQQSNMNKTTPVTSRKFLNFVEHLIVENARNNDSPFSSPELSLVKDTLPSSEDGCNELETSAATRNDTNVVEEQQYDFIGGPDLTKPTLQRTATFGNMIKAAEEDRVDAVLPLFFDGQQRGTGSTDNGSNYLMTKFQNDVAAASEHHAKMISKAKVSIKSRNSCDNAGESSTARVPSEVDF